MFIERKCESRTNPWIFNTYNIIFWYVNWYFLIRKGKILQVNGDFDTRARNFDTHLGFLIRKSEFWYVKGNFDTQKGIFTRQMSFLTRFRDFKPNSEVFWLDSKTLDPILKFWFGSGSFSGQIQRFLTLLWEDEMLHRWILSPPPEFMPKTPTIAFKKNLLSYYKGVV